eukprot:145020-Pelagomonas_calceolata.AAC.2
MGGQVMDATGIAQALRLQVSESWRSSTEALWPLVYTVAPVQFHSFITYPSFAVIQKLIADAWLLLVLS